MSETSETPKGGRKILGLVSETLNKADVVGGELRDKLLARYQESERAQRLVAKLQRLRGKKDHGVEVRTPGAAQTEAPADDAAPAAAKSNKKKGLGDAEVAAQIFGRSSCPWTGRAIRLLEDRKVDYDFIDMDDEDNGGLDTPLITETKQNTVPYVFLRGHFIGGYNALAEVDRLGQLDSATMSDEERAAHPGMEKVVIAPRPNTDEVAPGEA